MSEAGCIADIERSDTILKAAGSKEKLKQIKMFQKNRNRVAMVGERLEDAQALAQADVGIVFGTHTDLAAASADITLIGDALSNVPNAIALGRRTMRTIRRNLFLAIVYNLVLIPVAAGVFAPFAAFPMAVKQLHPILAVLAMALSSISVISNSLHLYREKIR